jgi:NCS1 family nucleobase:cation symporter-1
MENREQVTQLEIGTIRPIPADQRHGNARDLFTIWFGSNVMLLTVVTGGLSISAFHLSFAWSVLALTLGSLVGGVFMALHAAQGPTLGVPQMVQTRGQFGSVGSLLVVGLVFLMYVGFIASNLVLTGQAVASQWPGLSELPGIIVVAVIGLGAAIYGYDMIHAYTRAMSWLSGAVMLLAAAWIIWVHGLPADFLARNGFNGGGFLGVLSTAALWQIGYAPYVSDYSRYMPADTGVRPAFWASYWGCVLGSLLPMILGVMVAIAAPGGNLVTGLSELTGSLAPLVLTVFSIAIASATAMNIYCGALSVMTFGQTFFPSWSPGPRGRAIVSVGVLALSVGAALFSRATFLRDYEQFILMLLYVLVPWTAINLVDYYLLRHGRYDVASFFRRDGGIYGRVNVAAVSCYVIGFLVEMPFIASPLFTGPVARVMGGVDLSWIVGLIITPPLYFWVATRLRRADSGPLTQYAPGGP